MTAPSDKVEYIRRRFAPLIGRRLEQYETAELLSEGTWHPWNDLPLRLYFSSSAVVSICWSKFDDLSFSDQPFGPEAFAAARWIKNGRSDLNELVGLSLGGVTLGQGEMSIEGTSIEIWTRLVLQLGPNWLEVFNALDENGFAVHDQFPEGEFIRCV